MKFVGLALAITLSLVLLGSVGPVVQASDNNTDNATVNLEVEVVPPPPAVGGGIAGPSIYYTEANLFGTEETYRISYTGEIRETIEATSEDGMLTMTIPESTIALGKDGKRLKSLQTAVDESPPDPPEDTHIIGLAYDFGPDGATFDPAITFTWSYDPDALPERVAEEDLVIAYYDEVAGKWVELDCTVDPVTHTITARVSHFTPFAILTAVVPPIEYEEYEAALAALAEIEAAMAQAEGELAAAQAQVTSLQSDVDTAEARVASMEANVAAAQAQVASLQSDLTAAQERLAAAQDEVTRLEAARANWPLIGGIIAVVLLALILYLVLRRRRA